MSGYIYGYIYGCIIYLRISLVVNTSHIHYASCFQLGVRFIQNAGSQQHFCLTWIYQMLLDGQPFRLLNASGVLTDPIQNIIRPLRIQYPTTICWAGAGFLKSNLPSHGTYLGKSCHLLCPFLWMKYQLPAISLDPWRTHPVSFLKKRGPAFGKGNSCGWVHIGISGLLHQNLPTSGTFLCSPPINWCSHRVCSQSTFHLDWITANKHITLW